MERLIKGKIIILLFVDVILINLSYILAFYFMFIDMIPFKFINSYFQNALVITFIYIICFYFFKLYKSLWIYAGIDEFLLSIAGCLMGNIVSFFYEIATGMNIPSEINILAGVFSILFIVGFRMSFRIFRRLAIGLSQLNKSSFKKVLVIGAGSAGTLTINEMKKHPEMKYRAIGLIDDSEYKIGTTISGIKVLGNRNRIKDIAKEKLIDEIIIAIPSIKGEEKKEIIKLCNETGCKVRILPGIYELINGKVILQQIRDVEVEDLLGREQITLDCKGISDYIYGRTVLVTGGGGSIGSELCRQISRLKPHELLILDSYENNAYELYNELKFNDSNLNIKVIIASITDRKRMEKIFYEYRPQLVFHAAAHKHVPLMEDNPAEAIQNNVFGTLNVVECANRFGVQKFVMISTDKAVNPTNIMGASKRICEMIIQAMSNISTTEFVAVRFGNVLGSNGSVIPLFKKQISYGGPVTVTNKDITRYFMTITEAVQLVLQAGTFAKGGEIFVLDMGKPVKIYDLACDLIKLSGLEPDKDIKIEITDLRPGEKLYEELLMAEEGLRTTKHEKIFVGSSTFNDIDGLKNSFEELKYIIENGNTEELIRKIEKIVPTYRRHFSNCSKIKNIEVAAALKTDD